MYRCIDKCVGVLVIRVLVFTVVCTVCTVFLYCFVYVYLFLFVTSVLLTQYRAGDKIEKNVMGWACGAYG